MQMMLVTVPPGVAPGQTLQISTPSGQLVQVAVPAGVLQGQQFHVSTQQAPPGTVVQAQNNQFAPGAITAATPGLGGTVARHGDTANAVNNALGGTAKRTGNGVLVPCSSCGAQNETKMAMGSRAQFNCGQCGAVVLWRPRQVWLRDQGMPLEKSIHPQPGESDGSGCCVLL